MPRLGSAIASTILSYAALSVAGVDQVQAAVLTFNFQVEEGGGSGFFKLSNSSLTKTGLEALAVSEGRFNTLTASQGKTYYDLAGAIALFFKGEFRGLQASGGDREIRALGGHYYTKYDRMASWSMKTYGASSPDGWTSYFSGYSGTTIWNYERAVLIVDRTIINDARVSYTLVNTEPEPVGEPVPEPLTAGGTALALAGLSWLKHKKKMAA
jgi:hypothetical protein